MSRITSIYSAIFLLWLPMLLSSANSKHDVIECTVRDGGIKIDLKLKKTEQLLANEHLPIWIAKLSGGPQHKDPVKHILKPNLMRDDIGDFILYHDIEKSAAFVLFVRTQMLTGVVDTRYAITALPLHLCHHGAHLGDGYVEHLKCESMYHQDHFKLSKLLIYGDNRQFISRAECHSMDNSRSAMVTNEENEVTFLYLETMVSVAYDLTKIAKDQIQNNYLAVIVAQYIIYFNAIDMLISQLSTNNIQVHLNLAGIVIEEEENVFNFLIPIAENVGFMDVDKTVSRFLLYGARNHFIFPQDSFDFFFISTGNTLWSSRASKMLDGTSWQPAIYPQRCNREYIRFWPGAVIRFTCGYEYINAAHEIAHLLAIEHDPLDKGLCNPPDQCYGMMQEVNKYCPDCIKWSEESVEDFKKYIRYNRDRCFLLNKPRSLRPYGTLMTTLSRSEQCRCYGLDHQSSIHMKKYSNVVSQSACGRSLRCEGNTAEQNLPLPLDGTRCWNNGVCWNHRCEKMHDKPSVKRKCVIHEMLEPR